MSLAQKNAGKMGLGFRLLFFNKYARTNYGFLHKLQVPFGNEITPEILREIGVTGIAVDLDKSLLC